MRRQSGSTGRRVAMIVRRVMVRYQLELGRGRLVLAVSGGADSMALLLASRNVGQRLRQRFVVAHFAHGLRPRGDVREEALVRRISEDLGLPFFSGSGHVKGDESSARDARYLFLGDVARASGASAVLTAHTQNDQAETVLFRLTRGTGLRGAGAIRELSRRDVGNGHIQLLRPMLGVTRAETEAVCFEEGITPAQDRSNRSMRYARNRIRLRVIPELAHVNPEVKAALAAFAEEAAEDAELLEVMAADRASSFEERDPCSITWPKAELRGMPSGLLKRVLERGWRHLVGPNATLGRRKLEQAHRVIMKGGRVSLGRRGSLTIGSGSEVCMRITPPE